MLKGLSPIVDRFTEWFKDLGVCILRRKLHQLVVTIDERQRITADKMELTPQAIKFFRLCVIQHQSAEMLILTIE